METYISVNKEERDGVMIFQFSWDLDETNTDKTFGSIKKEIGDFQGKKVIFQLTNLKHLNSKSIGHIADIYSNIEENNGKMSICDCTEGVRDILDLVWVPTIIPVVNSLDEALKIVNEP